LLQLITSKYLSQVYVTDLHQNLGRVLGYQEALSLKIKNMGIDKIEVPQWLKTDMRRKRKLRSREHRIRLFNVAIHALLMSIMLFFFFFFFFVSFTNVLGETFNYNYKRILVEKTEVLAEVISPDKEIFVATITAYTSSVDETDDTPFITASGERTGSGILACPARYEFGTKIIIEGEEYVCKDRMNKRYREGDYFDIWVESKEVAFNWGRQDVEVEVIK